MQEMEKATLRRPDRFTHRTVSDGQQVNGDDDLQQAAARILAEQEQLAEQIKQTEAIGSPFAVKLLDSLREQQAEWENMTPDKLLEIERKEQYRVQQAELARRENAFQQIARQRGRRYADCRLSNYQVTTDEQRAVVADVNAYAAELAEHVGDGQGVVLYGPAGVGKDHLLFALIRVAVVQHGLAVEWTSGAAMFSGFRDAIDGRTTEREMLRPLVHPAVLAISDPCPPGKRLTEYQAEMLYRVVDDRYSDYRPTWITLNAENRVDAADRVGAATVDRLTDGALVLACNWTSYRRPGRRNGTESGIG